jgi:hypothetical protein
MAQEERLMADELQPKPYQRPKIERREVIDTLIGLVPIGSGGLGESKT